MWKFRNFPATLFLREINFGWFQMVESVILTILGVSNFEFLDIFEIFKYKIPTKAKFKAYKVGEIVVFDLLKAAKIDFT